MDVTPITATIEENAKQTADSYISEARARITNMQDNCGETVQAQQHEAVQQAQRDGDQLQQNLRRLGELDARMALLTIKRGLIDEAFDLARQQLESLPAQQLSDLILRQVVLYAKGDEQVVPGAVSGGFYGPAWLAKANEQLQAQGKPGTLTDAGGERPGVCGVVLVAPGSETHLTVDTLLTEQRAQLEGPVADILCSQLR